MNPVQATIQTLPSRVRKTLYWLVAIAGVTLGALQAAGYTTVGPLTMTQAFQVYAFLSPLVGVVAVANMAGPTPAPQSAGLGDLVQAHDLDLSAFEPVGAVADVFGQEQLQD